MITVKTYLVAFSLFSVALFFNSCQPEEDVDEDLGPTAEVLEGKIETNINEKLRDVSIDGNGTMYASTQTKIYKFDASGNATVFAGNDSHVVADGTGTSAGFNNIDLITFDEDHNLFVKDYGAIRKITPSGEVSSIIVSQPTFVQFNPEDLTGNAWYDFSAVHPVGDVIYTGDHYVMKIKGDTYSVFSGNFTQALNDGPASEASYMDLKGGFYEKETNSIVTGDLYSIRRIALADSSVTTIAGSDEVGDTEGGVEEARFRTVKDVVSDGNGNLYVADLYRIRKISAAGVVSTIAGPFYNNGLQLYPGGLAIDNDGKFLYITDTERPEPNPKGVLIKIDLSKI